MKPNAYFSAANSSACISATKPQYLIHPKIKILNLFLVQQNCSACVSAANSTVCISVVKLQCLFQYSKTAVPVSQQNSSACISKTKL